MNFTSIGDLSQTLLTNRRNTLLKTQMERLSQELSSGQSADVAKHLDGRLSHLADVERQITTNRALATVTQEAGIVAEAMQLALAPARDGALDVAVVAVLGGDEAGATQRDAAMRLAEGRLRDVMAALNTEVAGRFLFSGADTSAPALAGAEDLIAAARGAVAAATDASGFESALDAFFGPGGGFETGIYTGSDLDVSPALLGRGQSVQLGIRADSPAIGSVLRDLVAVSLAGEPTLALSDGARGDVMRTAGENLFSGGNAIATLQADLGFAASRIEDASVRINSELSSLQIARTNLVSVDPFTTAAELESVQIQLETLYAVTARSARLNLMSFLS